MLDRPPLIIGGAVTGVALASALWLVLGAQAPAVKALDALQAKLAAPGPVRPPPPDLLAASRLLSMPLFNTVSGSAPILTLRLDGLSIVADRKAALIAIGGKPADWLELGATRDGVTLIDLQPSKITVDTPAGFRDVSLGEGPPAPPSPAAASAPVTPSAPSGPFAAGFRPSSAALPKPQH